MKGKAVFTPEEATLIKTTIDACREAGRYSNQDLRDTLRKVYKFYISDFDRSGEGFTSADFDRQVLIGNIKIEEELNVIESNDPNKLSDQTCSLINSLSKEVEEHEFITYDHQQFAFALLKVLKKRVPGIPIN